jgi:cardiolipin synthase
LLESVIYTALASIGLALGFGSAVHALLNKRDPRSQLGWMIVCALVPALGAAGYWIFGVNRIRTRARRWQERGLFDLGGDAGETGEIEKVSGALADQHPAAAESMRMLLQISARVTEKPLLGGNRVEPLFDGEQAYPAMLEAIAAAQKRVYLCTYIFDTDEAGRKFVDALGAAAARGVDVRVLVDAIGERYARPRVSRLLRRHRGVEVALFLPLAFSLRGLRVNLRNHRKLLVCDGPSGQVGFTGGMNIGQRHMVGDARNRRKTADVHFRIQGPAVYALEEAFVEDWYFTTGQENWGGYQPVPVAGNALCRAIKDGPNEDFEKMLWILVGALTCAHQSVKLMTPYFIPSREVLAALNSAALRGVKVEIILPAESNLPFVSWACQAMLWEVLQYGTRVFYQPAPFNHSKILIVDELYVNLGSANIDPRSLRLNFEFNLEVYDRALSVEMTEYFNRVRARATEITAEKLASRPFLVRLRDAVAKLFSPYL